MTAPLYVLDVGAVLRKRGGRIVVSIDGTAVTSTPITALSEVVLIGGADISTAAMHALLRAEVPVVFLRRDGRALGRLEPVSGTSGLLRQQQVLRSLDPAACLDLAVAVVDAKLANQAVALRRLVRNHAFPPTTTSAPTPSVAADRLGELRFAVRGARSIEAILGFEGTGSRLYYGALRSSLPAEIGFNRRDRRGGDVVNHLTNYCSALVRETVVGALTAAGLDPAISFLHRPWRRRPALAFDLMEEWRPVLLDTTVGSLVRLGQVGPDDVVLESDGGRLSHAARIAAIERFHRRLDAPANGLVTTATGRTYGEQVRLQARLLRNWVRGDAPHYQPFRWR